MEEIADDIVERRVNYSIPTVRRFSKIFWRLNSGASLFIYPPSIDLILMHAAISWWITACTEKYF